MTNAVIARLPRLRPQIESFVPDGWDAALAQALEAIALLSEETGVPISITQFKEKFGDLRIYVRMDEPSAGPLEMVADTAHYMSLRSSPVPGSVRARAAEIIDAAAARCQALCQDCGAPARKRNAKGWLHVACDAHARR
uniref:Uncharacterized protein n=1 Tax=Polaromonas sp. H6N TaxID=1840293 RepID=A0A2S1FIP1_9BURK|nr:hypothetical protein pH6NP1_p033 [Polaromonas sp. H6N]